MQVVFTQDVKNVARKGDVKNVTDGYFRNFLQPNNLATKAHAIHITQSEQREQKAAEKRQAAVKNAEEYKSKIEAVSYEASANASDKGTLFAAITEKEVASMVNQSAGVEIDAHSVHLDHAIKEVGEHSVQIKLSDSVTAHITITVTAS